MISSGIVRCRECGRPEGLRAPALVYSISFLTLNRVAGFDPVFIRSVHQDGILEPQVIEGLGAKAERAFVLQ